MQTLFICLPISLNFISSCVIDHTAILENLKLGRSNCRSHFQLSCSILFSFSNACPQIDLFVPGNGFSVATQNLTTQGCVVCPGSLNDADHKRTKGIYGHSALHILEDHKLIFLGVISMGCIQYTAQPSCCFIGHSIYMNTGNFCRCDKSRLPFRSLIFLIVLNVYFQHFIGK